MILIRETTYKQLAKSRSNVLYNFKSKLNLEYLINIVRYLRSPFTGVPKQILQREIQILTLLKSTGNLKHYLSNHIQKCGKLCLIKLLEICIRQAPKKQYYAIIQFFNFLPYEKNAMTCRTQLSNLNKHLDHNQMEIIINEFTISNNKLWNYNYMNLFDRESNKNFNFIFLHGFRNQKIRKCFQELNNESYNYQNKLIFKSNC